MRRVLSCPLPKWVPEKRTLGLDEFKKRFNPAHAFIVGTEGVKPEDFLKMDLRRLF